MVSDARIGRVVAIGAAGRLWAWTGTTWSPLASGRGPQHGAAAVYDPVLGDLVVLSHRPDLAVDRNAMDHRPLKRRSLQNRQLRTES
jgi:hypothetical protein